MILSPGTRLGTYEIVSLLGAGGMGEVYGAKDLRLDRMVAVKILPPDVAASPERLARFEREARTVAGLNHPNVVTMFSVEDAGGIRFLTMELVEGKSLAAIIAPGGLKISRILDLAVPLADALAAAHEKGIVHRDLKPANVMVTPEGRVKVLDFGLARIVSRNPDLEETRSIGVSRPGEILGTVPYMAPEQIRGEAADARSDLFSLGVILYELAAGRRPFAGDSGIDIGHAILHSVCEPLSRVRAGVPDEFQRIVNRCLEKNPRDRFQNAPEVLQELRRLRRTLKRGASLAPETRIIPSIAVLPFVNRSRSEEDEYFSDGLADELIDMLVKLKGLRVAARASSFHFKGKDIALAEIGGRLNVAAVLDGSVRKAGNRVRISVQLVRVSDGDNLWSEAYDRTLDDVFAVQDDIARCVVKQLRTTLLGKSKDTEAGAPASEEMARAQKGRASDPEAHRLHLLARHFLDRSGREDTEKAIHCLGQALTLDPEFAQAWALLGRAHSLQAGRGWASVSEGYGRAREAVEHALALEPDLAEAHAHLGFIRIYHDWDWRGAEASYARALELAPGSVTAMRGLGNLAYDLDDLDRALEHHRNAQERDPLSSPAYHTLGLTLYRMGRFAEAEESYRKALELAPQRAVTHTGLALSLLAQDRGREALLEAEREPASWSRLQGLACIHHALGHVAESEDALRKLIAAHGNDAALQIAEVYGFRGEVEEAFAWIDRAEAQHDPGLSEVKGSPPLRSLHGDPRWGALLKRMGLEDPQA